MQRDLSGIPETLLIPLWARARETNRPDAIIRDFKAVEMLRQIDYDFSKFDRTWMSQLGVAVRTELLDRAVGAFIEQHPEAVIINLGAGLDTRFVRLDNGTICWMDLDLPEVMELRRRFFQVSDRHRFLSGSIFDLAWADDVRSSGRAVLLIAEGLLMYFEPSQVRSLFDHLVDHFPGAEMILEMLGPALVGKGKIHDTVSQVRGVEFRWSLKDSREFEKWNKRIALLEEWYYTDYHKDRWGWFGWITRIPMLKKRLANRLVHLRFLE